MAAFPAATINPKKMSSTEEGGVYVVALPSYNDDDDVEQGGEGAAGRTKKGRHVFPRLKKGDSYPFLEEVDVKDLTIFKCLLQSKPFAVGKGKGVKEAWASAVDEINSQLDIGSGRCVFDSPISVKTVRDRFDGAMKIIAKLDNNVPFRSGNDDEDSPNELRVILEDLSAMKTSFESAQSDVKDGTMAKKKKDRDAAKAIQEAAIGNWQAGMKESSLSSDSDSGEAEQQSTVKKRRRGVSMDDKTTTLKNIMLERNAQRQTQEALQREQLELQKEQMQAQRQLMEQQVQLSMNMCNMLKTMADEMKNNRN